MSCLYADMILDLRKNSMNEVEKRFIDEKLKTGKKRFCPKVPASTNSQREIFCLMFARYSNYKRSYSNVPWFSKLNLI